MNNNNNEPIVLGTLKKDKSSKPIFVLFIFILLLGTCFGLPYIKDYINNNNCTMRFENGLIRENVQYRLIKKGYIGNPNKIKITEEQRAEIRLKYPDTKMAQLSLEYNTSIATVSNIINNKK